MPDPATPRTSRSTPGLRERQKEARREALIEAAHRLVARYGLDAVTVDAICAEVGVSTRTFFNYFDTKDDAVLGLGTWDLDPDVAETFATGGPTGDLAQDLLVVVTHMLDNPTPRKEWFAAVLDLARREPRLLVRQFTWIEKHRQDIHALVVRRMAGSTTPAADLVPMFLMMMTHATFLRWEAAGGSGEARDHLPSVAADLRTLLGSA